MPVAESLPAPPRPAQLCDRVLNSGSRTGRGRVLGQATSGRGGAGAAPGPEAGRGGARIAMRCHLPDFTLLSLRAASIYPLHFLSDIPPRVSLPNRYAAWRGVARGARSACRTDPRSERAGRGEDTGTPARTLGLSGPLGRPGSPGLYILAAPPRPASRGPRPVHRSVPDVQAGPGRVGASSLRLNSPDAGRGQPEPGAQARGSTPRPMPPRECEGTCL